MHRLTGILLFILFSIQSFSQEKYTISGIILTEEEEPVPYANVLLVRAVDSTLVEGNLTREDGTYLIEQIVPGNYLVIGSMIGFEKSYSSSFILERNRTMQPIILKESFLDEVQVQGTKPLYQQKIDRMVINVENSVISAGSSALEILERSPGVLVNRQNNSISIVGKEGVVIMINGKNTYVPVSTIIQMLEGMSADNIVSIELITTPPANMDAEGNAGFINIVLKKNTDTGLNATISLSAGYSNAFLTSDNLNFNFRRKKLNIFGSYSFEIDETDQFFRLNRRFTRDGDQIRNSTISERDAREENHNLRLGTDYQLSEKTITGVLFTAYDTKWTMLARNKNISLINEVPESYVDLINEERNQWRHFGANYNIKHDFNEDTSLSFNLDYLYYEDDNPNDYLNSYFDEDREFVGDSISRSTKWTPIQTYVGALDYKDILEDLKFETGVKLTTSKFENDVAVENFVNGTWIADPTLTNKSELDENIYAAYISAEYPINDRFGIKAGLRYEFTDTQLDTETEGRVVDREYGRFFPSVFLNQVLNDTLSMNLSYSRRIRRPTFNNLAPFVILLDPNTFISGNASLQPSISNSYKYGLNYRSAVLSLNYTHEESPIANFQERIDEETGRFIFEASNLEYVKTLGLSLGFPWKVTSWWRMQNNFTYVNQRVRANYIDEPIALKLGNFSANISNSWTIKEKISAELSGFYVSKGFFGIATYDAVYRLDTGISWKLWEDRGTLKLNVRDVLNSFEFTGGTNIPEQDLITENLFNFTHRSILLSYIFNLGNRDLKASRNRETGAEEERRRID